MFVWRSVRDLTGPTPAFDFKLFVHSAGGRGDCRLPRPQTAECIGFVRAAAAARGVGREFGFAKLSELHAPPARRVPEGSSSQLRGVCRVSWVRETRGRGEDGGN